LPAGWLQAALFNRRIRRTQVQHPPVFILGYFRSGTTLLQKLMAADRNLGTLTNYDCLFPRSNLLMGSKMQDVLQRVIHLLGLKNPFFHNSPLFLAEAAEEDDYLMNRASPFTAYWGMVYPQKWREWLNPSGSAVEAGWEREFMKIVKYVTFKTRGKRLVLKSPPNTGRIRLILKLFPDARFIYLFRNPYTLYYSVRNMWLKAILPYYSLQQIGRKELDDLIFEDFLEISKKYEKEKERIPAGNLLEISYEDLCKDPAGTVKQIYSTFNLPLTDENAAAILLKIQKEDAYVPFVHEFSKVEQDRIEVRWDAFIRLRNYKRPVNPPTEVPQDSGPTPPSHRE
jgi:hypothetical protein